MLSGAKDLGTENAATEAVVEVLLPILVG